MAEPVPSKMPKKKGKKAKKSKPATKTPAAASGAGAAGEDTRDAADRAVPKLGVAERVDTGDASDGERAMSWDTLVSEHGMASALRTGVTAMQWTAPTPIQSSALPLALAGKDIIGLAETGSGKTAAFVLPILHALITSPLPPGGFRSPFALILSPTRELCKQIYESVTALSHASGLTSLKCVLMHGGGNTKMDEVRQLALKPHIIVASPGRLLDHLNTTRGFNLKGLRYLVLDEADRLFETSFDDTMDSILRECPRSTNVGGEDVPRRTYLYSATVTQNVKKLQASALTKPVKVAVSARFSTVKQLNQYYIFFPAGKRDRVLVHILNTKGYKSVIVFPDLKTDVERLARLLSNLGFDVVPLHGDMSQNKRYGALNKFKEGKARVLIATNVASRGLHIDSVDCVVNYHVPSNSEDYIHRVGRTARAGAGGNAISLVDQYGVEKLKRIERAIGKELELFPLAMDEVDLLAERVSEANAMAVKSMRHMEEERGGVNNRKRKNKWAKARQQKRRR